MPVPGLPSPSSPFSDPALVRGGHGTRLLRRVLPAAGFALAVLAAAPSFAAPGRDRDAGASGQACAPGIALGNAGIAVGGQYRLMGNGSNFGFHDRRIGEKQKGNRIGNQRFRTWLNVHDRTTCRYGAYTQVEIGHTALGAGGEFPKTVGSGDDEVGIELRRGFLWFKPNDRSLVRAGVVGWEDRFGERPTFGSPLWDINRPGTSQAPLANSDWDFSVGGLTLEATARETWHYALGALALVRTRTAIGDDVAAWLLTADVDRSVGSSLWGASVYYLRDEAGYSYGTFGGPSATRSFRTPIRRSSDLWIGGRGHIEHTRGSTALFLILNVGEVPEPAWTHTGWAAKAATTVDAGRGAVHLRALYSTGDDGTDPARSGEFRTIAQSVRDNRGAQAYWSLLGLTSPRGPSDVNDLGIGLQNDGLGLLTLQAGYEQPLASLWTGYLAAGWLRSDAPNPASGSTAIGTELVAEVRRRMGPLMALEFGGALLLTGDFFRVDAATARPATLYEVYSRWQLAF